MGPIAKFLTEDHARMDVLIERSLQNPHGIVLEPFGVFRQDLLRHIGMEEKILLPAVFGRAGAPLELAAKLRLEHGALTNLLVPQPSREILLAIRFMLEPHNRREEGPGGFYDACEALLAAQEADALVRKMKASPELPLRPYSKRPEALEAAKRAMQRAGFNWENVRENLAVTGNFV